MKKQTKAKAISQRVAKEVWERDGGACIICFSPDATPRCHFIRRSHGGLGIPENVVTLCAIHHAKLDSPRSEGEKRHYRRLVRTYLNKYYPGFLDSERVYRK